MIIKILKTRKNQLVIILNVQELTYLNDRRRLSTLS